ncbi:hypothetical protein GVAV_003559 [Gurleya vavrai]
MSFNDLQKYHLEENLFDLEFDTKKLQHDNKILNSWLLIDLFKNFKRILPDLKITLKECYDIIKANPRYIITPNEKFKYVIVSLKDGYNRKLIFEMVEQLKKIKEENVEKEELRKRKYLLIEDDNEEDKRNEKNINKRFKNNQDTNFENIENNKFDRFENKNFEKRENKMEGLNNFKDEFKNFDKKNFKRNNFNGEDIQKNNKDYNSYQNGYKDDKILYKNDSMSYKKNSKPRFSDEKSDEIVDNVNYKKNIKSRFFVNESDEKNNIEFDNYKDKNRANNFDYESNEIKNNSIISKKNNFDDDFDTESEITRKKYEKIRQHKYFDSDESEPEKDFELNDNLQLNNKNQNNSSNYAIDVKNNRDNLTKKNSLQKEIYDLSNSEDSNEILLINKNNKDKINKKKSNYIPKEKPFEDLRKMNDKKGYIERNSKNSMKANKTRLEVYADYKNFMLSALESSSVFLLTTFHNAMTKKHGIAFDYKKAPANKFKGVRSKLSLYLDDCNDIFERIQIKNMLFYKRIDSDGKRLVEKRKNTHLRIVKEDNEEKKYHLEILIVNLFPTRTTADIQDIENVFENIYGVTINSLIGTDSFKSYLIKYISPNMILKESRNDAKVTLIPSSDDDYREYGDIELQNKVLILEQKIMGNYDEIVINQEIVEEMPIIDFKIPVRSSEIFKTKNSGIYDLLSQIDYNVPKSLQINNQQNNLEVIYNNCKGKKFGYNSAFLFLSQNLAIEKNEVNN